VSEELAFFNFKIGLVQGVLSRVEEMVLKGEIQIKKLAE
jgi:hypothetical protein